MLETPRIAETPAQPLARIHVTVPRDQIRDAMGPGIAEVMATVAAQGVGPAGPWLTHHLRMDPEVFDFEICVPVTAPVTPAGRVVPGERPAMRMAQAVLHGPYEQLPEAWPQLDGWVAANGYSATEDLWEVYAVGPETSADPADWRTELNRPLQHSGLERA